MGRVGYLPRRLLGLLTIPSGSGVSFPSNWVELIWANDSYGGFPLHPKSRWTDTAAINHFEKPRLYVHLLLIN